MRSGSLADAYSRTGAAWDAGPARIYDRLSDELMARVPGGAAGDVLDLGAGTGAASRAARPSSRSLIARLPPTHGILPRQGGRPVVRTTARQETGKVAIREMQ